MKKGVSKYIAKCFECQQVKVECRKPMRFLQPIPILNASGNSLTWISSQHYQGHVENMMP